MYHNNYIDYYIASQESTLSTYRTTENVNIVWRLWYLDDFTSSDISASYLTDIQNDFNVIRNAGYKAMIRFAYTDDQVTLNLVLVFRIICTEQIFVAGLY